MPSRLTALSTRIVGGADELSIFSWTGGITKGHNLLRRIYGDHLDADLLYVLAHVVPFRMLYHRDQCCVGVVIEDELAFRASNEGLSNQYIACG